ncbi:tyrosine--tRNA ligase [Micavibrio aeruginosavorus]|uniref:tyrosine--tRNA ligase n=1 Tax=Micavibrio aeruginosavorus TaxID=349221 RepID=UPI003F4AE7B6
MASYKSEFLNILQQRGFVHQCSDFDGLDAKLAAGSCSAYVGYDPTGKSLHVGHMISIMMLMWFQKCGHKPVTLMGGGTAMLGDPSFKDKTRPLLTKEEIKTNIASIQESFASYIDYDTAPNAATMVNNADWLLNLNYMDFLREYGTHFTVNRMLTFDSVKLRLDREQPLTFLEFNYMIMQGYDFVELHRRHGTILQMGGSDQWGNMINGVELGRRADNAELFVLTCPLLTTASGAKMGKTENGAVWLRGDMCTPYDYWQYWRNTEDADVGKFLRLFTMLPLDEIAKLEALGGAEINEAKKVLAFEATKLCHGEDAAHHAAATAQKVFEQGGVGGDLPSIEYDRTTLDSGIALVDVLCDLDLASSKGDARRLIQGGGARVNDAQISDVAHTIAANDLTGDGYIKISSGKKKHALVRVKG